MDQYQYYIQLAKDRLKVKSFQEAKDYLLKAIQQNNLGAESYYLLGNIYHEKGKFTQAIEAYKKALSLKPNYTDAAISLSVLYNDLGKYEEGRLIFNRAKKQVHSVDRVEDSYINENLAQKHIELGQMYESYGRHEEALQEFEKALSLHEKPEIAIHIAKLYEKQGALSEALKVLKTTKASHPDFIPAYIQLGLTYYAQGKMIEATHEW